MIKEFWQERKAEKLKQKQLKKENKKLPKTKEQKAYKIFGVFFALFLVFGSLFYSCRTGSTDGGYSWDNLIGISDELKTKLSMPIDKQSLITNEQINAIHWGNCVEALAASGVNVVLDNKLNRESLLAMTERPSSPLILDSKSLGALVFELMSMNTVSKESTLIELIVYSDGGDIRVKTLMYVNLTAITLAESLPYVYLTTDSRMEILEDKIYLLDNSFKINNLSEDDNDEMLKIINENSLLGIEQFTTKRISGEINAFAMYINSDVEIRNTKVCYIGKSN